MTIEPKSVVPVIDISKFQDGSTSQRQSIARKIESACSEIGFFIVMGHGVPDDIVNAAWSITNKYFNLPIEDKRAIPMTTDYPYGYSGLEEETLTKSRSEESAPDLKESFCIGPYGRRLLVPTTIWPSKPRGFKKAWLAYYKAMEALSATLLQSFALGLGLDDNWFDDKTDRHVSALRALNYPILNKTPNTNQLRAGAHTDYGSLTILKSGGPGLQVKTRNGAWIDVPYIKDSFIVNLGDLMAYWTNDRWISTMHRVLAPPIDAQQRRQSITFFHNVNIDAIIQCIETCASENNPAKYPIITAGEHLAKKHAAATASL
jgi:isopenicillin N synthase-like dioxygenase